MSCNTKFCKVVGRPHYRYGNILVCVLACVLTGLAVETRSYGGPASTDASQQAAIDKGSAACLTFVPVYILTGT